MLYGHPSVVARLRIVGGVFALQSRDVGTPVELGHHIRRASMQEDRSRVDAQLGHLLVHRLQIEFATLRRHDDESHAVRVDVTQRDGRLRCAHSMQHTVLHTQLTRRERSLRRCTPILPETKEWLRLRAVALAATASVAVLGRGA